MSEILKEHVAIIATRAEWAIIANFLSETKLCKPHILENPDTYNAIRTNSKDIDYIDILDAIMIENVDTQLRIEKNIAPNFNAVKILRSNSTRRSPWEPAL